MPHDSLTSHLQDPVELLLRHISIRALAGTLLTGCAACSGAVGPEEAPTSDPATDAPRVLLEQTAAPGDAGTLREGATDGGESQAQAVSCPAGVLYAVSAAGLRPAERVDYLAIREVNGNPLGAADAGVPAPWTRDNFIVRDEVGTPCATATDAACKEKVAHHPSDFVSTFCGQICVERSVVTTRGDDVTRWTGLPAVRQLLGPIDSFDEALLLVSFSGYDVRCNDAVRTTVRELADGYEVFATQVTKDCAPVVTTRYRLHVSREGVVRVLDQAELERVENLCIGRRPATLAPQARDTSAPALGAYLAESAELEAASVHAFEQLARELEAHGAPAELIARALRARDDEVRHAALVSALAEAHGGTVRAPQVAAQPVRSVRELALENAVEGCVRETYGALIGAHQAACAGDASLRAVMVEIARDESRHAALSHAVHAWAMGRLDEAARDEVRAAQRRAICELAIEAGLEVDAPVRAAMGLPAAALARAMVEELASALWAPALAA